MLADIIQKIATEANLSPEQIQEKIEEKKEELSQMISDEGAAYIVAKELNISVLREAMDLKIENIVPGMTTVDVTGKVTKIADIKPFKTEKGEGRVLSLWIADETGSMRITLWNDEIDKASAVQLGDVVHIKGYVRENLGKPELRLGRFGKIVKSDRIIRDVKTFSSAVERSDLASLHEGDTKDVRAMLLKVFESNLFFETCNCGKHVKRTDEGAVCEEHGTVTPEPQLVLSGIIDDGTEAMRAVFFRDQAERLLGMTAAQAKAVVEEHGEKKDLLKRAPVGTEFVFRGTAKKNSFFNRLEFIVQQVKDVDVKAEIESLLAQEAR